MDYQTNFHAPKHLVIFSHGFGVRKDDGGLLTDIAQALPEVESILFDYYEIDEVNKTITTCAFSDQVKKLNRIVEEARLANPGAIIDLIGHSQGTVVAALARPAGLRKAILLAPSFDLNIERTLMRHRDNPESTINLDGISRLRPLNGLTRIVPAQYWQERAALDPLPEYEALADQTEIIAITANQDRIAPTLGCKTLSPKIKFITLDGDHDFSGDAREPLIKVIRECLLSEG